MVPRVSLTLLGALTSRDLFSPWRERVATGMARFGAGHAQFDHRFKGIMNRQKLIPCAVVGYTRGQHKNFS